jgi:hypothetical protein
VSSPSKAFSSEVDTGSREENASKQNLMLMEILGSNAAAAIGAGSIPG